MTVVWEWHVRNSEHTVVSPCGIARVIWHFTNHNEIRCNEIDGCCLDYTVTIAIYFENVFVYIRRLIYSDYHKVYHIYLGVYFRKNIRDLIRRWHILYICLSYTLTFLFECSFYYIFIIGMKNWDNFVYLSH